jgi:hypothetical protein
MSHVNDIKSLAGTWDCKTIAGANMKFPTPLNCMKHCPRDANRVVHDLAKVTPRVSPKINEALLQLHTVEEVKMALFSIGDMKAHGSDGLHA